MFVNIGVKGEGAAEKALASTKEGLDSVAESSLAVKAGILAALYGLEKITGAAGAQGMALKQFAESTGLSTDQLQRWQYAARQFGVQGEEVAGTAKSIQSAMTNMLLGKGAPQGMAMVANKVGFDMSKARDTFYVMDQLQKFSKTVPPDIAANVLKSFGVSEGMFQFFRQNKLELDKIRPSNLFSKGEIDQLARVDVAWANLWQTLKLMSGKSVAANGLFAINEIRGAISELSKLWNVVKRLADLYPSLKYLAMAIAAVAGFTFAPLTASIIALIAVLADLNKGKKGFISQTLDKIEKSTGGLFGSAGSAWGGEEKSPSDMQASITPPISPATQAAAHNVEINQNLNFQHDGKDAAQTADAVKKAIHGAFRQMNAQTQGS